MSTKSGIIKTALCAFWIFLAFPVLAEQEQQTKAPARKKSSAPRSNEIPQQFSIPPPILEPRKIETFRCRRQIFYDGKMVNYDANVNTNCDMLIPIVESVDIARQNLSLYQDKQLQLKKMAYVTSLGVGLMTLGLISGLLQSENTSYSFKVVSNLFVFGGLWLGVNSFIYSISLVRLSDEHFFEAIHSYNRTNPERPIELKIEIPFGN